MTTDPRRRRTRAEQQAETRTRLLEAATDAFAAHGFDGASIDQITDLAGYTRGAFYSNFSDKAELLLELSSARMEAFADVLPGILATREEAQIAEAARWLVAQAPPVEVLLLVELARLRADNPEVAELLDGFVARSLGFVDEVLDAAPDQLSPTSAADRDALPQALLSAALGLSLLRHLGVEVEARTAELLLAGVLHSPVLDDGGPADPATAATDAPPADAAGP
jgi:AcrR family transcriptional regulator